MKNTTFVKSIFPNAKCEVKKNIFGNFTWYYILDRDQNPIMISSPYRSRRKAWKETAKWLGERMLRKFEQ